MRKHKIIFSLHFVIIFTALMVSDKLLAAEETLGHYPLCEASAALLLACPDGTGECLLVGDNEQGKELYLFPVKDQKLDSGKQSAFDLHLKDGAEISDIEALAGVSGDKILAFASHSRDSKCEIDNMRHQYGKVSLSKANTAVVDTLLNKNVTCENLVDKKNLNASMKAACDTIDAADTKATLIDNDRKASTLTKAAAKEAAKKSCNEVNAYNAEGAVVIGNDVWIGLRAPLLPVHPPQSEKKNLAILLHMKDLTAYTFDRVAFLDLGGRGVRDLSSDATNIYVIAGPSEDRAEPFELRHFPKSALDKTDVINTELNQTLPSSSEGLAISGKTAYIVIDGDKGKNGQKCNEPAGYKIVSLP